MIPTGGISAPEVKTDVQVKDDDILGDLSLFSTGTLEVVEGGSAVPSRAEPSVSLTTKPDRMSQDERRDLVLSSTDPDLTLALASLTFADENWNPGRNRSP